MVARCLEEVVLPVLDSDAEALEAKIEDECCSSIRYIASAGKGVGGVNW